MTSDGANKPNLRKNITVATIHAGSCNADGARSDGSMRKLCPPRRAKVSTVFPFKELMGLGRRVRWANVLVRRSLRSGCEVTPRFRLDLTGRTRLNNRSRRRGTLSSSELRVLSSAGPNDQLKPTSSNKRKSLHGVANGSSADIESWRLNRAASSLKVTIALHGSSRVIRLLRLI